MGRQLLGSIFWRISEIDKVAHLHRTLRVSKTSSSGLPVLMETMFVFRKIFANTPEERSRRLLASTGGQSLIEVALMVPIFTILVCYAVDFGYFFMVATSLTSTARNSVEYAVQGPSSTAQSAQPSAVVVSTLAIAGIGLSGASTSTVSVRVCSSVVGTTLPANTAQCTTPSSGAGAITAVPHVDPESPTFQLNRVDVAFTVTPLIPIPIAVFPTRTFHRMVEMRSIQ